MENNEQAGINIIAHPYRHTCFHLVQVLIGVSMNVRHLLLNERLNQMHRYLHIVHSALGDEQERFLANIQDTEDEDWDCVIEMLYDELVEVRDEFPRMTYSSFIVAWFSTVEHELIELCEASDLSISIGIRDQERFGTGIHRAYTFLKKGADYRIPDIFWHELIMIKKIRNIITHNDGRIKTFRIKPTDGTETMIV